MARYANGARTFRILTGLIDPVSSLLGEDPDKSHVADRGPQEPKAPAPPRSKTGRWTHEPPAIQDPNGSIVIHQEPIVNPPRTHQESPRIHQESIVNRRCFKGSGWGRPATSRRHERDRPLFLVLARASYEATRALRLAFRLANTPSPDEQRASRPKLPTPTRTCRHGLSTVDTDCRLSTNCRHFPCASSRSKRPQLLAQISVK